MDDGDEEIAEDDFGEVEDDMPIDDGLDDGNFMEEINSEQPLSQRQKNKKKFDEIYDDDNFGDVDEDIGEDFGNMNESIDDEFDEFGWWWIQQ